MILQLQAYYFPPPSKNKIKFFDRFLDLIDFFAVFLICKN